MADIARTLESYLSDPFNQRIFQDLEQLGVTDPLPFFHRFYGWVSSIEGGKAAEVIKEIRALNYPGGMAHLVFYLLLERIRPMPIGGLSPEPPTAPPGSITLIEQEHSRLSSLYPADIFAETDPDPLSRLARQCLSGHEIASQVVDGMLRDMMKKAEHEREIESRARQSEREKIEANINEIVQAAITAAGIKRNPEFTLNRQVLALGFMLKHLGVKDDQIEKTKQAKFIEFLINKTQKDIYDALRESDDRILLRKGDDARYVAAQFRSLGLEKIARDIESTLEGLSL